ncbi:MAG: MotA/TolQ/ExbB proton channel family protein [Gemmataceae bacterium]|nr:MotA/TolQ/ExbB proton channel family protein [Gemmataceae bacterium]MDW8263992.1 MotA/TolQ/ExbB proton channel family protein [Gemmataceae bacterium]
MALTSTQRPTREGPLLVLALALVGAVCIPLWQWSLELDAGGGQWSNWTPERLRRLLLGPEQIASYFCFTWASFIIGGRYLELRRQRRAFSLDLLPTEEGRRILPEDARPLLRKVEHITAQGGPYVLANMIRLALNKYATSRSSLDVSETVRTQAEVDLGRLVTSMATVHYLAWAIPALGFLGTVRGLAGSLSVAGHTDAELHQFIQDATRHLNVAFDCTLIALVLSLVLMFLVHSVQRDEEALVIDAQQYCLEHLVNRLYDPETLAAEAETDGAGVAAARVS